MTKQEAFWIKNSRGYAITVEVIHMSKADVDPRKFASRTRRKFLRVPFAGKAHWAFETHDQLEIFKLMGE